MFRLSLVLPTCIAGLLLFLTLSCVSTKTDTSTAELIYDPDRLIFDFEASGINSLDDESRLIYSVLLRNVGRYEESRIQLKRLIENNQANSMAWYNLALLEHAVGNSEMRNLAIEAAIELDDAKAEVLTFCGTLAIENSNWEEAAVYLQRALEIDPEYVEALTAMAWVKAKSGQLELALTLLNRAVELDPEYVYARIDRSRINVALRNYSTAERDLDKAIELEPDVQWHYLDRARIRLRHLVDYEGALADLETVEKLNSDNFFALVYLAGLHDEQRRFSEARNYYLRVVELRPDYSWAHMPLGKLGWIAGEYSESEKWFAKAAEQDPEDYKLQLMLAMSKFRLGKIDEADRLFLKILQTLERGGAAYEVVRFCAERNSDYYAINVLNKEIDESLRERLWYYMGAVYETQNNTSAAIAVYERLKMRTGEMEYDLAWAALKEMEDR